MKKNITEGLRYLGVGMGAVGIDFVSYMLMSGIDPSIAKGLSYVFGASFAFFANKYWTFRSKHAVHREMWKFAMLYFLTFSANVGIHVVLLNLGAHKLVGFTFATGFSIVVNYIGQKFWVFKGQR